MDLLHLPIATPHRHIDTGIDKIRLVLNTGIMMYCCAQGVSSSPASWSASRDKKGRHLTGIIFKVSKDVAVSVIVSDCSISSLTNTRLIMSILPAYENY